MTKLVSFLLLVSFILLAFPNFLADLPFWPVTRHERLYKKALLTFINVVPEPGDVTKQVAADEDRVKTAANILNRIGYLRPPLLQSNLVRAVADPRSIGSLYFGHLQGGEEKSGEIELWGEAFLPDKRGPADAVLITYDNTDGEPVICGIASIASPRAGRLRATWDSSALPSKWKKLLPTDRLRERQQSVLKAWSYDAEACRAYRLDGSATVTR